jgi:hypothetical protein
VIFDVALLLHILLPMLDARGHVSRLPVVQYLFPVIILEVKSRVQMPASTTKCVVQPITRFRGIDFGPNAQDCDV